MSFKERVDQDRTSVFLNLQEFAEVHLIDGIQVVCVVNEDGINSYKDGRLLGVIEADIVIFGKAEDLNYQTNSPVNVDGREYIVVKVAHEMGIIELALKQIEYT